MTTKPPPIPPKTGLTDQSYVAFISYRHTDNQKEGRQWASWLHHTLETYEVPEDIVGTKNLRGEEIPSRLFPVFRDEAELPADADLSTPIVHALEKSQYLVVLCSPGAVASRFVEDEIARFKAMGKESRVIAAILSGEPNASNDPAKQADGHSPHSECFPEPLRFEVEKDGSISGREAEPLAADFRLPDESEGWTSPEPYRNFLADSGISKAEVGRKVAEYSRRLDLMKLKIIAGIIGVPLGVLTKRDKAYQLEKAKRRARVLRLWLTATALLACAAITAGVFAWNKQQEAEARKAEVIETLATSDFQQGSSFLEDVETTPQGMALLARSLRNGGDSRAAIRLWTLLQQRSFWIPVSAKSGPPEPIPHRNESAEPLPADILERFGKVELDGELVSTKRIVISGNGERVATIVGGNVDAVDVRLRIWDSKGTPLSDWFAPEYSGWTYLSKLDAKFSHDGQFLAIIAYPWRGLHYIEIHDIKENKVIGDHITSSGRGPENQYAPFSQVEFLEPLKNSGNNFNALLLTASTKGDADLYGIRAEYDDVLNLGTNRHSTSIVTAVIDPEQDWLMSSSSDGEIRVTDISNGDPLGDLIKLEQPASKLERSGESQLTATLVNGEVIQFLYHPSHAVTLPADLGLTENSCFRWSIDPDNPPTDNILSTDPISKSQVLRLSDRRVGLRKVNSTEVIESQTFASNLDTVGIHGSGQYLSTTTTAFITEIWDGDFSHRLGPPFNESRFFEPGKTPQETKWVTLLPDGRTALLESFFWDPPNLGRSWYSLWDIRTGLLLMDRTPVANYGQDNEVDLVRLDHTGQYILFLTDTGDYKAPNLKPLYGVQISPPPGVVNWLPDLAEALAGVRYNRQGNPEPVPDRQRQLQNLLPLLTNSPLLLADTGFAQKATSVHTSTVAQKAISVYTSTAMKDVKVLSSSELEGTEGDQLETLCKGEGGYELLHRGGERSWIDVRFKGITSDLYRATMQAGRGNFVAKENDVVEWRGFMKGDVFTPYAIIYRVMAQDPEDAYKNNSTLIVVALNEGNAQILGTAYGEDEDAKAKKLADTAAP